jgi:hypothetical protein
MDDVSVLEKREQFVYELGTVRGQECAQVSKLETAAVEERTADLKHV